MANIKSAKKRIKVNAAKAMQNKATKSNLKTVLKDAEAALENKADNKEEAIKLAIKKVDQAAAKGLLHKNAASRKKSSLACKLNAAG
jgi:small subunit ribosomal protein S20